MYTYHNQPLLWVRFIDDVFMIWTHGRSELEEFLRHLNNRTATISFTMEASDRSVSFLDTRVIKEQKVLFTDLYTKWTDTHDYLLYESAHPKACKDSIPHSQFLRIRRICARLEDFEGHAQMLVSHFRRRHYPAALLEEALDKARQEDRRRLLFPQALEAVSDRDKVFLITTYHPTDHTLREIVKRNWELLGRNRSTHHLFEKKLVVGYRRPKNLRDLLVRALIPWEAGDEAVDPEGTREDQPEGDQVSEPLAPTTSSSDLTLQRSQVQRGSSSCNWRVCRYCPTLDKTGSIVCNVTGLRYDTMQKVSCCSSNLVYCVTCKRCGKQYVGQTMLRLKDRFVKHFYDISRADSQKSLGHHFSGAGHEGIQDVTIHVLEFVRMPPHSESAKRVCDRVERRWIHLLRCLAPAGLNVDD